MLVRAHDRGHSAIGSGAEVNLMRGGLLWLIGVPIPIIILLYLFHVL